MEEKHAEDIPPHAHSSSCLFAYYLLTEIGSHVAQASLLDLLISYLRFSSDGMTGASCLISRDARHGIQSFVCAGQSTTNCAITSEETILNWSVHSAASLLPGIALASGEYGVE